MIILRAVDGFDGWPVKVSKGSRKRRSRHEPVDRQCSASTCEQAGSDAFLSESVETDAAINGRPDRPMYQCMHCNLCQLPHIVSESKIKTSIFVCYTD